MRQSSYFETELYFNGGQGWMDFDKTTTAAAKSLLETFVGEYIGSGQNRDVFQCAFAPKDYVIKVGSAYDTQNAVEVTTWKQTEDRPAIRRWLAPIVAHSPDFRVIVQRRTMPLLRPPKKIPDFLCDLKVQNFGLLDGKVVAHDYGLGLHFNNAFTLEAPDWWDDGTGKEYE